MWVPICLAREVESQEAFKIAGEKGGSGPLQGATPQLNCNEVKFQLHSQCEIENSN